MKKPNKVAYSSIVIAIAASDHLTPELWFDVMDRTGLTSDQLEAAIAKAKA